MTWGVIELRVYLIELPAVMPGGERPNEDVARMSESWVIKPEETCELWVRTKTELSK